MMVDLQPQPELLQSHPNCMNWISESWTSEAVLYFKMISGFCISRDWTHFLPPKSMCTEFSLWKIWLEYIFVYFFYVGTAPTATGDFPTTKICSKILMNAQKLWEFYFRIASSFFFDCDHQILRLRIVSVNSLLIDGLPSVPENVTEKWLRTENKEKRKK